MAEQAIQPGFEGNSARYPINEHHIPNFVAPGRKDKIWLFGPTSMQTSRKRSVYFGDSMDDGTAVNLQREQACISAGLGCIITKDLLDALPKHTYQIHAHPSFTITVAQTDGRLHRINTCKDVVVMTLFMPEVYPNEDGQRQMVQIHRTAVVVPAGSRLLSDGNIRLWLGADDIARDGSKRQLFRDSSDGKGLVVIHHDGTQVAI
jgi:hypothetical protein